MISTKSEIQCDPSTNIQRPSSAKIPDASHILTRTFGDIFTKDLLTPETIKNLSVSSGVDNTYHSAYVEKLRQAQIVKEERMQKYSMLEKHILEARAKALANEERENDARVAYCARPDELGIPPAKSYIKTYLNDTLLKQNGLIAPSDYIYEDPVPIPDILGKKTPDLNSLPVLPPIETPKLILNEEKFKANLWKENLSHEERIAERDFLRLLENKTRFLQNPRFISPPEHLSNLIIFKPTPEIIEFKKYIVGRVYETTLELKNVSLVMQQFKVIPPKTQYFSLSLGKFPQNTSAVSPGLSAFYNIRFAPDSLGSYEDELVIEFQSGTYLRVPLIGKRDPPVLSIGTQFDCGESLVGQIKICRFIIQNMGGEGRFAILPKASWPATNFKTNISSSTLSLNPFDIQPSIFEVHRGDSVVLEIIFKPSSVKRFEQDVILTCDNGSCQEFKIIGEGQLALLEIVNNDEPTDLNQISALIDELIDPRSDRLIHFPTLNPNVYTKKIISIQNKSSSPIDFSWIMYKPLLEKSLLNENEERSSHGYVNDSQTTFSIEPQQGTFDRNECKTFEITFSPIKVSEFDNVAHLVLHNIPEINKALMNDKSNTINKSVLIKEDTQTVDFVSFQIQMRGKCEPFTYALDPPAIILPCSFYPGVTTRKGFRLINMSICPINFNWKQIVEPYVIQVEPSYGEISPKSYALMEVLITGTTPGLINDNIPCFIEFVDEPIYLHVEAEIKPPECVIREKNLDFGLVPLGKTAKSYLSIENISTLAIKWSLVCESNKKEKIFDFEESGCLNPLEEKRIEIVLEAVRDEILEAIFELKIENGKSLFVKAFCQIQRPIVALVDNECKLDNLYLDVDFKLVKEIVNYSSVDTYFEWGLPEGEHASHCQIDVQPKTGHLMANSTQSFKINLKPNVVGHFRDILIPCYLKDVKYPIFMKIDAISKSISVEYQISETRNENIFERYLPASKTTINFTDIGYNKSVKKYLQIKNASPIPSKIAFNTKNFKKSTKIGEENSSDTVIELDKNEAYIPPNGHISIGIIVSSTVWGTYKDTLEICIEKSNEIQEIPILIDVNQNPLKIYSATVTENSEEIPCVRFGTQIQGKKAVTRKLKMKNQCNIRFEIDWNVFLVQKHDQKLLDLNLIWPQEQNFENRNLFKIHLTEHFGKRDTSLFYLDSYKTSFNPFDTLALDLHLNLETKFVGNAEVIFVGYVNLKQDLLKGDFYERKSSFHFRPIKFKATANIVIPSFTLVNFDESTLNFDIPLGDLIENEKIIDEIVYTNDLHLVNNFTIPMDFTIHIDEPFYHQIPNSFCVVESKKKRKISALFKLRRADLHEIRNTRTNDLLNQIYGNLQLIFSPGKVQKFSIKCCLWLPKIECDTHLIDFGIVLVGQSCTKYFILKNVSKSNVTWSILNEPSEIFQVDCTSGLLESDQVVKKNSERILNVTFVAKHDEEYYEDLRIKVDLIDEIIIVKLKAIGSYDEQDEINT